MTASLILRRLRLPALVALIVIVLDQISKAIVLRTWPFPQMGEFEIIGQWLAFTYIRNDGVAFGLFQGIPQFFTITSLVIVAVVSAMALGAHLWHGAEIDAGIAIAMALACAMGALGGAELGPGLPRRALGHAFALLLVAVAVLMLAEALAPGPAGA